MSAFTSHVHILCYLRWQRRSQNSNVKSTQSGIKFCTELVCNKWKENWHSWYRNANSVEKRDSNQFLFQSANKLNFETCDPGNGIALGFPSASSTIERTSQRYSLNTHMPIHQPVQTTEKCDGSEFGTTKNLSTYPGSFPESLKRRTSNVFINITQCQHHWFWYAYLLSTVKTVSLKLTPVNEHSTVL
jgi:hypothetical protein